MDSRLNKVFGANSPFLYVRGSVLANTAIRHRMAASKLGGSKVESVDTGHDSDGRPFDPDRDAAPFLPSLAGTPGARRNNFTAAEVCYELSEQDWAEIASLVDGRTADELKAWRDGQLTPANVGWANYQHFQRQIRGPSTLRWLILTHQKAADAVTVHSRAHCTPQATSRRTCRGLAWEHTTAWRDGNSLAVPVTDYSDWITVEQACARYEIAAEEFKRKAAENRIRRSYWDAAGVGRLAAYHPGDVQKLFLNFPKIDVNGA
jgi:hypothetical protein